MHANTVSVSVSRTKVKSFLNVKKTPSIVYTEGFMLSHDLKPLAVWKDREIVSVYFSTVYMWWGYGRIVTII